MTEKPRPTASRSRPADPADQPGQDDVPGQDAQADQPGQDDPSAQPGQDAQADQAGQDDPSAQPAQADRRNRWAESMKMILPAKREASPERGYAYSLSPGTGGKGGICCPRFSISAF